MKKFNNNYQYRKGFETVPKNMQSIYFSREVLYDWMINFDIIETTNATEKQLLTANVFKDIMSLGGLYTHLTLEIFNLVIQKDPSILSTQVIKPINDTESNGYLRSMIKREAIISIMNPYLTHNDLNSTKKYKTVPLFDKISNIRVLVLKEKTEKKMVYDILYPIVIKPSTLSLYRNSDVKKFATFEVMINSNIFTEYAKCKNSTTDGIFITIPKYLYYELSKLCDNANMLEDVYNLLLCARVLNTNNVERVVCTRTKFMSILPHRWTNSKKTKAMEFRIPIDEIKNKLKELVPVLDQLRQVLKTDIQLLSNVDLPTSKTDDRVILYYQ